MKNNLFITLIYILSISRTLLALNRYPDTVVETYDELDPSLVSVTPVGTVNNLDYTAFAVSTVQAVQVGGVSSQSGKNRLVSSVVTQRSGTPSITINASSKYKSFSPLDFYFGCALFTTTAAAAEALQCTVTVAGFVKKNNRQVALASYTFTPPVSPVAPVPMMHAVLPDSFQEYLDNVTLIQTDPATTVVLLDSFRYKLNP